MTVDIRHLGGVSRARVRATPAQVEQFDRALLAHGFVAAGERRAGLEWHRPPRLLHDDWPLRVRLAWRGDAVEIDYGMVIPWPWIVGLAVLALVGLPLVPTPYPGLFVAIAALAVGLATVVRRFDCRPDARWWQQRPRARWHATMTGLLQAAFG